MHKVHAWNINFLPRSYYLFRQEKIVNIPDVKNKENFIKV